MQQLQSIDNRLAKIWAKERRVGEHLPYSSHVDDRTIRLRDGRLMQVLMVDGLPFETSDSDELDRRKSLWDGAIKALGSSRFGLYQHVVRRRVDEAVTSEFPDPFSAQIEASWASRRQNVGMYSNRIYLSVILKPSDAGGSFLSGLFGKGSGSREEISQKLLDDIGVLAAAVDALEASLFAFRPTTLTAYKNENGLYSEPLEYIATLLNGESSPVAIADGNLADFIPSTRISFGVNAAEFAHRRDSGPRFVGVVAVKEYPSRTSAGFLDELMRLPFELQVSQSFGIVERRTATGRIGQILRRMRSSEDDALSLRDELVDAKDDAASGRSVFGEHHLAVSVFAHSEEELNASIAEVRAIFGALGIVAVREDVALEASFWSQFPGNFSYIARKAIVSSRNFAGLASMHNFSKGQSDDLHWGEPISILETTSQGPYNFNFHSGDLGNFTIIGPSGSGKTVALNFLLAQSRRIKPRIVLFDKDRGSELFVRALGGTYDRLRTGIQSTFNPLHLDDTPDNRAFLIDFISQLVRLPGGELSPKERSRIANAVSANMDAPLAVRRMEYFSQLLRGSERPDSGDLYARFEPWWGDGEFAWLFDNAQDQLDLSAETIGFDMTQILDKPDLRTPAMMYLFHRIEERLDGSPSIIVIDEGWKALDDEVFVRQIRDWEKTIRKRNGILGFATQNADDALESQIASAVIEQSATQIFMPNPQASSQAYMEGFGLSDHELNLIRALPEKSRAFLVKQAGDSVIVRLDLSADQNTLEVLAGRESSVRVLDNLMDVHGKLPPDWLEQLLERVRR